MKKIRIVIPVILAVSCVYASCSFMSREVLKGLGMVPELASFEKFYKTPISMATILYSYKPQGKPEVNIRFKIENLEQIKMLQDAFRITSVEPYSLGVVPDVAFYYYDGKNRPCIWKIRFRTETEILFAKNLESCFATLTDGAFYQMIMDLAWENNKRLFPESKRSEIKI